MVGFKLSLAEAKILKDSLKVITSLVDEATLIISKESLNIGVMESSNIAYIDYKILCSAFVEYDIKPIDKVFKVGINIKFLYDKLKKSSKNDMIVLEYQEGINDLIISFKDKNVKKSKIPVLDLEERRNDKNPIDKLNFNNWAKITTDSLMLKKEFEFIKDEGLSFVLTTDKDKMVFNSVVDIGEDNITISKGEDTFISLEKTDDIVNCKYSSSYFNKFLQSNILSDKVFLKYCNDFPLLIVYEHKSKFVLRFLLAPRVEND